MSFFLDSWIPWNHVFFVAFCPKPEIAHGKLSVDKTEYVQAENVNIQCDSGYKLVGPQSITCSESTTWDPEVPKCEWVSGTVQGKFQSYQTLKMVPLHKCCPSQQWWDLTCQDSLLSPSKELSFILKHCGPLGVTSFPLSLEIGKPEPLREKRVSDACNTETQFDFF